MLKWHLDQDTSRVDPYPLLPPLEVKRPVMLHTWSDLSFVHWPAEPGAVQSVLPDCVTVDEFGGAAWIGLVPFHVTIRAPGLPRVPWVSSFEEMNVRTYVRGPDGTPGVWFITLDAARLGAVLLARMSYRLKYFWSKLNFSKVGNVVTYATARRWPGPRRAEAKIALEVDEEPGSMHLSDLERFLTARWCFYCTIGRRLYRAQIEHEPWPIQRARLLHCDPGLIPACGLPPSESEPLVHYSNRVDVRMGAPKRVPFQLFT
jgi:uncharacterized protein YqjF (DUF2071 family)